MPIIEECEIRSGDRWDVIGIAEALDRRGEDMRCAECYGKLVPLKKYSTGARAHFEHAAAHDGCSTRDRTFSGTKKKHPSPLEEPVHYERSYARCKGEPPTA